MAHYQDLYRKAYYYQLQLICCLLNNKDEAMIKIMREGITEKDFTKEFLQRMYKMIRDGADSLSDIALQDKYCVYSYNALLEEYQIHEYGVSVLMIPVICKKLKELHSLLGFSVLFGKASRSLRLDTLEETLENIMDRIGRHKISTSKKEYDSKSILNVAFENRSKRELGVIPGYDTGIPKLNNLIGGIQKGQFIVIGGYTSYGKSALGVNMTISSLIDGAKVLFFSLEMSQEQLINRMLANISGRHIDNFMYNSEMDEAVALAYDNIKTLDVHLFDDVRKVEEMLLIASQYKKKGLCDVVIIDYLQNLNKTEYSGKYDMLEDVCTRLQSFAIQEDVAVIALSQVNRDSVNHPDKVSMGFKGAGDIEESADVAIIIDRKKDNGELTDYFGIQVKKNRQGMVSTVPCTIYGGQFKIKQNL